MNRAMRHKRIRKKIRGTQASPRLCVFRSLKGMWAQLINDSVGRTLASAHHKEIKKYENKLDQARLVGLLIGERALKKNITRAVFDRGGYQYQGRVKALAEGAREGGLLF